ncbi:hypothetical protein NE865_10843 [Phthorimaea operculella]|nr:hypothetical protein NE865_10843 [Phthorimaea operculella]
MNFALTPKRVPVENIICGVEEALIRNKIPSSDAETMRQDIAVILRKARLPTSNATAAERQALKALRENKEVLVLKADKGNATVVMDTTEYDHKIQALLEDVNVYKPVNYNPTARVYNRIRALIKDHEDLFTEDDYVNLHRPRTVQPPKLYGLP